MRILALDAALARCAAGIVIDEELAAQRIEPGGRGQAALLAPMVQDVLGEARIAADQLDLIAATIGPGSFTGIRAALALAHGLGLAGQIPVIGVTVGEALARALPRLGGRALWVAIAARRGRIFLDRGAVEGGAGGIDSRAEDDLPAPPGPLALAGDAAGGVAARLAARDIDVMLTDARAPLPRHIALIAAERHAGTRAKLAPVPLYVDPPEAHPPAAGLRPPPVP